MTDRIYRRICDGGSDFAVPTHAAGLPDRPHPWPVGDVDGDTAYPLRRTVVAADHPPRRVQPPHVSIG